MLIDPNTLSADGTVALADTAFTDDGKLMAYALAKSGSDWHEWRVREVATGKDLPDLVEWSKFSGAAWLKDGSGFYYGRFDAPKAGDELQALNQNQRIYFHKIGTPQTADTLVYERPDHPTWGFSPVVTDDGRYLLVYQSEGTENKNRMFVQDLATPGATLQPFLDAFDAYYTVVGNDGPTFYVATDRDAPRGKLVAIGLSAPQPAAWKPLIAEGPNRDVLDAVTMLGDRFVVTWQIDARHALRVYDLRGALEREIALPTLGSVNFSSRSARSRRVLLVHVVHLSVGGLSLRSGGRRQRAVPDAEAGLHAVGLRDHAGLLHVEGRHEDPDVHHRPQGLRARRQGADDPLRLRRLQHLADAGLLRRHRRLAGAGRPLRRAQPARRRRIRRRHGTTPAGCSTSRTCSTTSSPPPST